MLSTNFAPFPVLETERLLLRQLTEADSPQMLFLRSDEDVMKYIDRPRAASLQDALDLISGITKMQLSGDGINWAITLRASTEVIGTVGLFNLQKEHYRGEIGYMLHPAYQRQGIMREALLKVLPYIFTDIKLHSIEANTNVANRASQLLLENLGFKREAYFTENYYYNGHFMDSAIYCLVAPTQLI